MAPHRSVVHPDTPPSIGQLYTVQEVATMLRVTYRAVHKWIYEGTLPGVRFGTALRIRQADLEAFGVATGQPAATTATAEE
jgi:excisionase family DNA binding protein